MSSDSDDDSSYGSIGPPPRPPDNQLGEEEYQEELRVWNSRRNAPVVDLSNGNFKQDSLDLAVTFLMAQALHRPEDRTFDFKATRENRVQLEDGLTEMFSESHRFKFPETTNKKQALTNAMKKTLFPAFAKHFITSNGKAIFASVSLYLLPVILCLTHVSFVCRAFTVAFSKYDTLEQELVSVKEEAAATKEELMRTQKELVLTQKELADAKDKPEAVLSTPFKTAQTAPPAALSWTPAQELERSKDENALKMKKLELEIEQKRMQANLLEKTVVGQQQALVGQQQAAKSQNQQHLDAVMLFGSTE